jgi:hypothetical protein
MMGLFHHQSKVVRRSELHESEFCEIKTLCLLQIYLSPDARIDFNFTPQLE